MDDAGSEEVTLSATSESDEVSTISYPAQLPPFSPPIAQVLKDGNKTKVMLLYSEIIKEACAIYSAICPSQTVLAKQSLLNVGKSYRLLHLRQHHRLCFVSHGQRLTFIYTTRFVHFIYYLIRFYYAVLLFIPGYLFPLQPYQIFFSFYIQKDKTKNDDIIQFSFNIKSHENCCRQ